MKNSKIIISILAALSIVLAVMYINKPVPVAPVTTYVPELGAAQTFSQPVSATIGYIGKGYATRAVGPNAGRTYLEISNLSGATSTAQTIYCITSKETVATSSTAMTVGSATSYIGFAIQASSSKVFSVQTGLPSVSVYCINPIASSTIATVDF